MKYVKRDIYLDPEKNVMVRYQIVDDSGEVLYSVEGPAAWVESVVSRNYKKILQIFRS